MSSNNGVERVRGIGIPVFGDLELFLRWDVHPLLFVLENFADSTPLHTVLDRNVFLSGGGVLLVIQADLLAVDVEETLLFVFSDHWGGIDLGLTVGWPGGRRDGRKSGRHAQGGGSGSGVRVGVGIGP